MLAHAAPSLDTRLLQRALAATRDGIAIADARREDMPLIYVNPSFVRLTGYAATEVLGRNCRFLQGDRAGDSIRSALRNSIASATPCMVTLRNYRRDGSSFWNELSVSPVRGSDGNVTHFIGIQKNVSVRIRAFRQLQAENRRLEETNEELEELAVRDALTGLYNRRFFQSALEIEWRRAQRDDKPLACTMIDVDDFKAYNDRYGHPAGDECLQHVAGALNETFQRAGDLVVRYGGEEFVVLGFGLDQHSATTHAQRLCNAVEQLSIPHAGSRCARTVTVSVGVASVVPTDVFSSSALLDAADVALYDAKSRGRNRASFGTLSAQVD